MQLLSWMKATAVAALMTSGAFAAGSNGMFSSSVIGSVPGITIGGVSSGDVKWTMSQSGASLQSNGPGQSQLQVQIQGLVIASGSSVGTTGSVRFVAASVVCGGSGGGVVTSSAGTPITLRGNAQIQANIPMTAACRAPVILVRAFDPSADPSSQLGPFIASTGLGLSGNKSSLDADPTDHDQ